VLSSRKRREREIVMAGVVGLLLKYLILPPEAAT
jgi:hypothetical protein